MNYAVTSKKEEEEEVMRNFIDQWPFTSDLKTVWCIYIYIYALQYQVRRPKRRVSVGVYCLYEHKADSTE